MLLQLTQLLKQITRLWCRHKNHTRPRLVDLNTGFRVHCLDCGESITYTSPVMLPGEKESVHAR